MKSRSFFCCFPLGIQAQSLDDLWLSLSLALIGEVGGAGGQHQNGMDGWIFHVGNELNQFLRQDKDSFDKSPYVVPRHQPYSWNGFFVVVEAFHEHGGELVCGAIVSVRRGRTVEVQFFFF